MLPREKAHAVEELILALEYKSTHYDQIVSRVAMMEELNFDLSQRGVPYDTSAPYLYRARSAFAVLFMVENPSITPGFTYAFERNPLSRDQLPYVYLSEMQLTENLRDSIVEDMKAWTRLHHVERR
jgi:hypothetical protein